MLKKRVLHKFYLNFQVFLKLDSEQLFSKYEKIKNAPENKEYIITLVENRAQEVGLAAYNINTSCFLISQV